MPSVSHPTASVDLARALLRHASRAGVDTEAVCRSLELGGAALERPGGRLSLERFAALWEAVALRAGDAEFGLHFGAALVASASGHLLLAILRNCSTVGDAIDRFFRYHALLADIVRPELSWSAEVARVAWSPPPRASVHRHHVEAVLTIFVTTMRQVTEDRFTLQAVRFRHPGPAPAPEHRRILGAPVVFGAPANEAVFDRRLLALPLPLASTDLLQEFEAIAQKQIAIAGSATTWAERTAHAIRQALLGHGGPGLDDVARALALGPRTLQARLRQDGTSYRLQLDRVRRELATALLGRPDLALFDVAFLLGFAEQSAFNHAFKRWTGVTPNQHRRSETAGAIDDRHRRRGR